MDNTDDMQEMTFANLAEYRGSGVQGRVARGNIVKAGNVRISGNQRVGIVESDKDQPLVLLHREGDIVTGAEFVCQCGRHATLKFEYEDK